MDLQVALEALGTQPALTLISKGIHGYRKHPYLCPVSNYLRSCGFDQVQVGTDRVYVGEGVSSYSCSLPPAVSRFVVLFDAGLYPEIWEK